MAAVHRQPRPEPPGDRPAAARSSRPPSPTSPSRAGGGCTPIGALDLLPAETAQSLKASAEATRGIDGLHVNVAVGYGGRREIADAVRSLILEHAAHGHPDRPDRRLDLDVEQIAQHLYTKGQPDPDLVIRTSGEQRLGGFLLWQSAQVGVLLLRGVLARLPARRLPPGAPLVCRAGAPVRPLTRSTWRSAYPSGCRRVSPPGTSAEQVGDTPATVGRTAASGRTVSGDARHPPGVREARLMESTLRAEGRSRSRSTGPVPAGREQAAQPRRAARSGT